CRARAKAHCRADKEYPVNPRRLLEKGRISAGRKAPNRTVVAREGALEDNPEDEGGAGDRSRTGYLNLGKVALYQVSYARSAETNDSRSRPRPPPEAPLRPRPTAPAANTLRRAGPRARRPSSTR